jgi:hypothetical protein
MFPVLLLVCSTVLHSPRNILTAAGRARICAALPADRNRRWADPPLPDRTLPPAAPQPMYETTGYFTFKNNETINNILWRPIFIIVQFVIVLWLELNCVKIPQDDANKSANRFDIYAPKVE